MMPIGRHLISCGCIMPAITKHPTIKNNDRLEGDLQPIVEICTSNPTYNWREIHPNLVCILVAERNSTRNPIFGYTESDEKWGFKRQVPLVFHFFANFLPYLMIVPISAAPLVRSTLKNSWNMANKNEEYCLNPIFGADFGYPKAETKWVSGTHSFTSTYYDSNHDNGISHTQ